jgi:hypothetical protein
MPSITAAQLKRYRSHTYRLGRSQKLSSPEDAVRFVDDRGFVYFWPIKGVEMPSLWAAVAGERPVADKHDDPGHVTWGWKDSLLGARRWYYGKLLRGKATMVSLPVLKYFYALSENFGSQDDYLLEYEAGRLTQEAKVVYEVLLHQGALDTVALRREARLTSRDSNTRFERALTDLQTGLRILPIGIAKAGAWRYAFIYELADRHFPDLPVQARAVTRAQARQHLLDRYLRSLGAATETQAAALFRWKPAEVRQGLQALAAAGCAHAALRVAGQPGTWWLTPGLLDA